MQHPQMPSVQGMLAALITTCRVSNKYFSVFQGTPDDSVGLPTGGDDLARGEILCTGWGAHVQNARPWARLADLLSPNPRFEVLVGSLSLGRCAPGSLFLIPSNSQVFTASTSCYKFAWHYDVTTFCSTSPGGRESGPGHNPGTHSWKG